ncbi:hypothetical protein [Ruficoccus sp. ZRK36]|uniref:hypothetical protein n=1 Tax=Ruficoccus sp. ZRK36 TaxID=2866311 RepID=UPI001C72A896|nr:hypothetical protein [Ruficoccus sp. ZRK36]QYY35393.1 hypothetical protein K0V07_13985 [Ruficoccus sp. ZRK36]
MTDQEFDNLITQVRQSPLPDCPGSLESHVLRRVRLSRNESEGLLWSWFTALLPKPAFVAAVITLVVGVSVFMTVMKTTTQISVAHKQQLAVRALDFGVLSNNEIMNFDNAH